MYRRDEIVKNALRRETRLDFGATFSKMFRNFTFRDRNVFEHRSRSNRIDTNLYRQRIQINHPVRFHKKELFLPFISEEGYYDLGAKSWVLNDFYAGISRCLNARTTLDIAYVRSDTRPVNVNGVRLGLKFKLR